MRARLVPLALLVTACCVSSTAPDPAAEWAAVERHCILAGDTVGVIKRHDLAGTITECIWILAVQTVCSRERNDPTVLPLRCRVGEVG